MARAFRKPVARKRVPRKPLPEVRDLEEDRETIAALNRAWCEMGIEEAELFAEADQAMAQLGADRL